MLNKNGIRTIIVQSVFILVSFVILFAVAGTLTWLNAWAYFVLVCVSQAVTWVYLARVNPEVVNARGNMTKADTKSFDRVWMVLYPLLSIINLFIIGFDAVRFHWSSVPLWVSAIGVVIFIPASIVGAWAMGVNKFFEWSARIQKDREQYVCTDGPYRYVRHPGYVCLILSVLTGTVILGSWWGLVLSGLVSIIVVIRTALEDRMLQDELSGYREYAQKVKYRLLPFVW